MQLGIFVPINQSIRIF